VSPRIVILTGERGVGKTTVCRKTVALARARGYTCGGVLTLSRPDGDRDVLDVRSGEVRRLTLEPGAASAVVQGRFRFDPVTLAWGGDALAQALPCHLFVVDELGPLELQRGEGWIRALDVLHAADFTLALVVVRPELVEPAQSALPPSATTVIPVTTRNRDELPQALWEMLEEKPASTF